jgi:hypothetical protein
VSRVVEGNGVQVLPPFLDGRGTVPAWFAHLCADADLRTLSVGHRELAAALIVEAAS